MFCGAGCGYSETRSPQAERRRCLAHTDSVLAVPQRRVKDDISYIDVALMLIFKQFYLNCLAHASYLIGDSVSGTAAVVDPQRDVQQYLDEAKAHGVEIRHVILTHLHADF